MLLFESDKAFKLRLLDVTLNILREINRKDLPVSPEGLKSLLGILYMTYEVDL